MSRCLRLVIALGLVALAASIVSAQAPERSIFPDLASAGLDGRSGEQLLRDAEQRRTNGRLSEAVVLAYLALRTADAKASPALRARVHLFLSETTAAFGYRAFERIHAKAAFSEQQAAAQAGLALGAGPFLSRLGEVSTHGGDYVLADYFLRLALRAFETAAAEAPIQHAATHIVAARLQVRRTKLMKKLDGNRVQLLQSAHDHLDKAVALVPDLQANVGLSNAIQLLQAELLTALAVQLPSDQETMLQRVLAQVEQQLTDIVDITHETRTSDDRLAAINGLIKLWRLRGDHVRSMELASEALDITETRQRGDIDLILNMALTAEHLGSDELLVNLCRLVMNAEEVRAQAVAEMSSEAQALVFANVARFRSMVCLALLGRGAEREEARARQFLDIVLRRKAIVMDAESTFWKNLHGELAPDLKGIRGELVSLRELLSNKIVRGHARELWSLVFAIESTEERLAVEPDYRAMLSAPERADEREAVVGYAEAILAGKQPWEASAKFEQTLAETKVSVEGIQAGLPPDTVLIEFARVDDFDLDSELFAGTARYWALLLPNEGQVRAVDLGPADELEYAIAVAMKQLRSADPMTLEPQLEAMTGLYDRLWAPLAGSIADATDIVLSVDGALGVVPFAALYGPDAKFVIEHHRLRHTTTGRSLAGTAPPSRRSGDSVAVVDPDYDARSGRVAPDESGPGPVVEVPPLQRLLATQEEGDIVQTALGDKVQVIGQRRATESTVRAIAGPRVLHLATHGLFLGPDSRDPGTLTAADEVAYRIAYPAHVRTLSRSGLAFSGFNRGGLAGTDDAFLTAFDVASMNLVGTDLVVLSGCDTGLGDASAGEGVLGLRRAFRIAGARHIVMSLWKQKDKVAVRQMRAFYDDYRQAGDPVAAVHDMQLAQIKRYRRILQHEAPPVLWAAWTIQGH